MERQNKNNAGNNHNLANNHHQQQQPLRRGSRPSVGYLLFQYQSELTRRHAEPNRLSRTKIHIIDGLVSRTVRHLKHCSVEELQACKRELVYKEHLRDQLQRNQRRRKSTTTSGTSVATNGSCSTSNSSPTSSRSEPLKPQKAPTTPPKPRVKNTTKVTIFGPEIFV